MLKKIKEKNKINNDINAVKKKNILRNIFLLILFFLCFVVYYFLFLYIKVDDIQITSNESYLFVEESKQMSYKLIFNKEEITEETYNKFDADVPVEWFVNNDCATITEDGVLTAISKGKVVVSIKRGDLFHEVEMEIKVPVKDIIIEDIVLSTIKNKQKLEYTLIPSDAYLENIDVLIEDENIATYNIIDKCFYMNSIGTTSAKISCNDIEKEISIKVLKSVENISANNLNLIVGTGGQLNVKSLPEDAELGLNYKYTSSDETIAKVNEKGWVSAIGSGTATIIIENEFGVSCEAIIKVQGYPLSYSDATSNITIYKEWYGNAWVYAAHITFADYNRFGTACGRNVYGGAETTSSAAARQGAILCINGCYSAPYLNYATARSGVVMNDGKCYSPGVYSKHNGLLLSAWESGGVSGYTGVQLSSLVASGAVTDTFTFGPPFLINGAIKGSNTGSRAQRTFIGTNGNPGDIWLCVSDGRYNDGVSAGLTGYECAAYLQSKGCTLGIPLDGGGSSTIVFRGTVLNAARGNQRSVVDFAYFR